MNDKTFSFESLFGKPEPVVDKFSFLWADSGPEFDKFSEYYQWLLKETKIFCKENLARENEDICLLFLERLKSVAERLEQKKLNNAKVKFQEIDLPFIFAIAWLLIFARYQVKWKKGSEKSVVRQFLKLINQFPIKENKSGNFLLASLTSRPMATFMIKKIVSVSAFFKEREPSQNSWNLIHEFHTIVLSFVLEQSPELREYISEKFGVDFEKNVLEGNYCHDAFSPYVTELPKQTCPGCGRFSFPCIDSSEFDPIRGFLIKCQFCGHKYGFGGKKKPLFKNGRRVCGTIWRTGKFEVSYCQFCGRDLVEMKKKGVKPQAHHIIPVSEGGEDIPSNIMVLCPSCHKEAHKRRENLNHEK